MMKAMPRHNRGTVLVLSLLILLVLTIVGVASMSNVLMQERMAGNVNLQSLAFEAASAGISEALEFGIEEINVRGDRIGDCSIKASSGNQLPWPGEFVEIGTLAVDDNALSGVTVHYLLKTDCLELPKLIDTATGTISVPRFESYVTSRGEVRQGNDVLAAREIEVRVDSFRRDALSAMRVEGTAEIVFDAGNSKSFIMDGQGGSAISTSTPQNSAIISQDLATKDRVQNFIGGVGTSQYPPPFHDAAELARFVLRIKSYMKHHRDRGLLPLPVCDGLQMNYIEGNLDLGGSNTFHGITYVTGNVTMGGNPSGSGLLIAEGTVQWRGTADFQGLVINLGGQFTMSGGGTGETEGMIYNANLDLATLSSGLTTGDYLDYSELQFGGALVDPWFDMEVVDNGGTLEVYAPSLHDPMSLTRFWIPGLVSKLETTATYTPDTNFRGLAYHRLYSGCDENNWLPLDADGNHACKGSDDGFGITRVIFDGGGGHLMRFDCQMVDDLRDALEACPLPPPLDVLSNPGNVSLSAPPCDPDLPMLRKNCPLSDPWQPLDCNTPGRGGRIEAIISWRENIGWREALD